MRLKRLTALLDRQQAPMVRQRMIAREARQITLVDNRITGYAREVADLRS